MPEDQQGDQGNPADQADHRQHGRDEEVVVGRVQQHGHCQAGGEPPPRYRFVPVEVVVGENGEDRRGAAVHERRTTATQDPGE